jgi:prepilin-type N-terminal cleavage/methylation domain-containing protein
MHKNTKGFTLIELSISVAIFAFMITGMTLAFQQQQRQFNLTKEASDIDQTARSTLDFLATEIRNSASRQGKTFALGFFNGGSDENCTSDTDETGKDSPPDCITLFTWDITRGQNGSELPSVAGLVRVTQSSPELKLLLPPEWFKEGKLIGETESSAVVLLGFRSRVNLCNPDTAVNCGLEPEKCTECSVILEASVDGVTKLATVADLSKVKAHNFPVTTFSGLSTFINGVTVGSGIYGFLPTFASQPAEITVVNTKSFRINSNTRELEIAQDGGAFVPIAGGVNSAGIVDMQFVFNLQDGNGAVTKVGVPLEANDNKFPDFTDSTLTGREQDIRSVEIYIVVRSRIKPIKQSGGQYKAVIPALGDAAERTVVAPSGVTNEPEEGYIYRTLSTTVYMRNHAREEFG